MKLTVIHFNGVLQRNIKHFHYVFIVQGIIYEDTKTLSIQTSKLFYLIIMESQAQLTFIRPQMIFHKIRILKDNSKCMYVSTKRIITSKFSNEIAISIFTLFKERQLSDKSNTQPFIHFSNSFKMQQF